MCGEGQLETDVPGLPLLAGPSPRRLPGQLLSFLLAFRVSPVDVSPREALKSEAEIPGCCRGWHGAWGCSPHLNTSPSSRTSVTFHGGFCPPRAAGTRTSPAAAAAAAEAGEGIPLERGPEGRAGQVVGRCALGPEQSLTHAGAHCFCRVSKWMRR